MFRFGRWMVFSVVLIMIGSVALWKTFQEIREKGFRKKYFKKNIIGILVGLGFIAGGVAIILYWDNIIRPDME